MIGIRSWPTHPPDLVAVADAPVYAPARWDLDLWTNARVAWEAVEDRVPADRGREHVRCLDPVGRVTVYYGQ